MTYRLKIADEAASRLRATTKWYAERSQSLDVAIAWYDGFIRELHSLEQDPLRWGLAPENELFDFELREIHYGSGRRVTHRALYRVVGKTVEVLTIRHHAERPLEPGDL